MYLFGKDLRAEEEASVDTGLAEETRVIPADCTSRTGGQSSLYQGEGLVVCRRWSAGNGQFVLCTSRG